METAYHPVVIDRSGLDALIALLRRDGYRVIGPTVRDGAITLAELDGGADLPDGIGVETGPGHYRLTARDDGAVFAHSAGPQSVKTFLHPPSRRLYGIGRDGTVDPEPVDAVPTAFLGVRPCDLRATAVLDRVLTGQAHRDEAYAARRADVLFIAANCTEPGATCFCASAGGGPRARDGYDLVLTERTGPGGPVFLAEPDSPAGAALAARLPARPAAPEETASADADLEAAAGRMGRELPDVDLRALLRDSRRSPRWEAIAERCLTCANCTLVCPTCYCTTPTDTTDLSGDHAERWEHWDSCFDLDFSYLHGGSVRQSGASRYRQWMSHKLSTWHDQFGGSGCVGCGRCVAWCPAGIDIVAEAAGFAADQRNEARP